MILYDDVTVIMTHIIFEGQVQWFWTAHSHTYRPFTFKLVDHQVWYFWTIRFHTCGPSAFILLDSPFSYFWTVHFYTSGPFNFFTRDRPFSYKRPSTVAQGRPLWLKTVHFWTDRSLSRGHSLWGPSTLAHLDRSIQAAMINGNCGLLVVQNCSTKSWQISGKLVAKTVYYYAQSPSILVYFATQLHT